MSTFEDFLEKQCVSKDLIAATGETPWRQSYDRARERAERARRGDPALRAIAVLARRLKESFYVLCHGTPE